MMKTGHYNFDCGGLVDCLQFLVENKGHYYSQSLAESLVPQSVQQRLVVLTLHLVWLRIMVQKNAKDMI